MSAAPWALLLLLLAAAPSTAAPDGRGLARARGHPHAQGGAGDENAAAKPTDAAGDRGWQRKEPARRNDPVQLLHVVVR